jgi:hypothetical protein
MEPENLKLYRWWRDNGNRSGITRAELARRMGITDKALDNKLHKGKLEHDARQKYPEIPHIEMAQPWQLSGDWMIVGDVHAPFTDYGFAGLVGEVARAHLPAPRRLLIAGDFFNMDAFSSYAQVIQPPTWAQEREAAKALLLSWLETFDEIRVTLGNHDRRLQKFTAGAFETDDILSLIYSNPDRVRMSVYGWCEVRSGGYRWRVTHPRNYSVNRLAVANDLAMKYRANLISFHEHHLGITVSRYGGHVIVNGGCLIDPKKVPYAVLDDSKSPDWVQGFVMLRDGVPTLFGDAPFTDWRRVLPGGLQDETIT